MVRIGVDAMGGDNAPNAIVQGCIDAIGMFDDVEITLFGSREAIEPMLGSKERIGVTHAPDTISVSDSPAEAIRKKPQSSIVMMADALKEGRCDAALSAGSTGALLAAGVFRVGRMKGVSRPALAPIIPTLRDKPAMLLDVGANADCKPEYLCQFAQMGAAYMRVICGVDKPKVALINIGAEPEKGSTLYKEAHKLLAQSDVHFLGNIEPRDLLSGEADVLVCDGFVGNVVLKQMEGLTHDLFALLKTEFTRDLRSKIGAALLYPRMKGIKLRFDPSEYGGSPLLGLNAPLFKAHGSSNARAIAMAVNAARSAVLGDMTRHIQTGLGI